MKSIKLLTVFALTALCATSSFCADGASKGAQKKEIALQLYSLRDDIKKDYAGTIEKAGKMGFTAVEAAGYNNGKFYGRTPAEFKADVEAAGMKVLSSHVAHALSDKEIESGDFSEALKWWDTCLKAHKEAGMEYVVVPWQRVSPTLKELDAYCKYYNEIGKKCAELGMKFGYHNHAHEFKKVEDKTVMYDYMLKHTDPKYVFFQMDVYWVVMGGHSPVEYFKQNPNRFKLLHIKDLAELGQSGMVGFDAIFNNMKTAGTENVIVEVERYNYAPEKSVELSLKYLLDSPFVPASCK